MAIELSSAGVKLMYAVESTASGGHPTAMSGFTNIPSVKSIPDFNPEPSALETTDLAQTEWKTYIPGLKDPGGAMGFGFNNTEEFQTTWATIMEAYQTGAASNKRMWFAVVIPGLSKSFYFAGEPSPLGLSAIEVDSVLEIDAYITPTAFEGWAAKPTSSTGDGGGASGSPT